MGGRGKKVKLKVKISLCLTKHHIMRTYLLLNYTPRRANVLWEWRYSYTQLTSALDVGEW